MNLENLNLVELNSQEVQEVDGGINGWVAGVLAGVAYDIFSNPTESYNAFMSGFNQWK